MMKRIALACLLTMLVSCAQMQVHDASQGPSPDQRAVLNSEGFLSAHPDLRWRREGLGSLEDGRADEAMARFKRAARYADKPSQAMIAEMLWTGRGVEADRPLAYAWMDIAAERGYIPFVAKREQYWGDLSAAERAHALEAGRPLMDEYGDAAAKPRLERVLRRATRNITGSRTGFVGFLEVIVPGPGGVSTRIDGAHFYEDKYWEPEQYWVWQDSIWKDPPTGRVNVLPLEKVEDGAAPAPPPDNDDAP